MPSNAQSWVDAIRAESTAMLLFSKVPGCYAAKATPKSPFDFLLSFLPGGEHAVAVEVKGLRDLPGRIFSLKYSRGSAIAIDRLDVPLLLLLIKIDTERAFYGWIRPPSGSPSRISELTSSEPLTVPVTELRPGELQRVVKIKNTRQYRIHHSKGSFRLYVSEHFDGSFFSTVLYYSKHRGQDEITLGFAHRNFKGRSEEDAYNKALRWVNENLGRQYSVTEDGPPKK